MRKKTLLTTVIAIITAVCLLTVGCGKSDDKTASNDVEASGEDMTTTAEDEVADALKEYGTDVETSIADDGTIYVVEAETDKSGEAVTDASGKTVTVTEAVTTASGKTVKVTDNSTKSTTASSEKATTKAQTGSDSSKSTTAAPTQAVTQAPTKAPAPAATQAPTKAPAPTQAPTKAPAPAPTEAPTKAVSKVPSNWKIINYTNEDGDTYEIYSNGTWLFFVYGYDGLDLKDFIGYNSMIKVINDYKVTSGICLYKYIGNDTKVTIPSSIDGYPVTILKNTFLFNQTVTKITVPKSVEMIWSMCNNATNDIDIWLESGMDLKSCDSGPFWSCGDENILHCDRSIYEDWKVATGFNGGLSKVYDLKGNLLYKRP